MKWYDAKCAAADKEYEAANKLFRQWQIARPFLRVGACPYSRGLVCQMIEAYSRLLWLGASHDFEHLEYLKGLLTQDPNPYDPITFDLAESGVISFS
jgi:hypothetical protein